MAKNINLGEGLFLTGVNIEGWKARYENKTGRLEQLATGVYIPASLTPEARRDLVLGFAPRIVDYLFPRSVMLGSTAYHRGVVDGWFAISTPRGAHDVDVGGVFKVYVMRSDLDIGMNKEVESVTVEDARGTFNLKRLGDPMLIIKNLQSIKGRPEATYLNAKDLAAVIERYTSNPQFKSLADAQNLLVSLARSNGMPNYEGAIIEVLSNHVGRYQQEAKPLESYNVFWHAAPVARLDYDGHIWTFKYSERVKLHLSLAENQSKGLPPSFLGMLLPEVGLRAGEEMTDNLGSFSLGHRYLSNITVKPSALSPEELDIIPDVLDGELKDYCSGLMEFTGKPHLTMTKSITDPELLKSLQRNPNTPRLSGMQAKVPAYLDRHGILQPADGRPFTHIVKTVSAMPDYTSMCSMEWYSLTIAKLCGLNTEQYAIVDLGGFGPSLVVERFDVRRDLNDRRLILSEDFWSILGLTKNDHKYHGELLKVADRVVKHSTNPAEDGKHLLKLAVFSWLSFNSDMHLKNMMLVKETTNPSRGFESVRFSPVYDVLCTQVFPNDAKSSAINLSGSRHHTLKGFRALGAKFKIPAAEVDALCESMALLIPMWAEKVAQQLPGVIKNHPLSMTHIGQAQDLFKMRSIQMLHEVEAAKKAPADESGDEAVESFDFGGEGLGADDHAELERRRSGAAAIVMSKEQLAEYARLSQSGQPSKPAKSANDDAAEEGRMSVVERARLQRQKGRRAA